MFENSLVLINLFTLHVFAKNFWVESASEQQAPLTLPFTIRPPQFVSKAATTGNARKANANSKVSSSLSGAVPAQSLASTLVVTAGIGTPPKPMNILLDSGSSLFWVRSRACSLPICTGKQQFNSADSKTFKSMTAVLTSPQQQQFIQYGDGTRVNCSVNQDSVLLGGMTVPNQRICEAFSIVTSTPETDGILGFGPPQGKGSSADFMKNFQSFGQNSQISFVYNMKNDQVVGGEVSFGGIDGNRFDATQPTQWYNISDDRTYWSLKLRSISNSSNGQIIASGSEFTVVVDSGTTQNHLPTQVADLLNAQMGATLVNGQYMVDCDKVASIPSFVFNFGGAASGSTGIKLAGSQLIIRNSDTNTCSSIFQPTTSVPIFGAWFMKNFYTVFDYNNARIGFATPVSASSTNTSPISSNTLPLATTAPNAIIRKSGSWKSSVHTSVSLFVALIIFLAY